MAPGEFELIGRYFTGLGAARAELRLGVGDDAAVLQVPAGTELVQALDTVVAGVHFPADSPGRSVGHRALAVNLSDLAAMGAEPAWALLGLTLPAADEAFVAGFAAGFDALARRHGVALAGGDTTRGPLAATVALSGWVPAGQALRRAGARPGDTLWVSGSPGEAGAGLALLQGRLAAAGPARERLLERFFWPEPRVALGQALRGLASACIDVSDGLLADLGHLCRASGCGADLDAAALPLSATLRAVAGDGAAACALTAGDDCELLFSAPAAATAAILALDCGVPLAAIGRLRAAPGIDLAGLDLPRDLAHGFEHFSSRP